MGRGVGGGETIERLAGARRATVGGARGRKRREVCGGELASEGGN